MPKYTPNEDDMDSGYGAPVTPPENARSPETPPKSVDQENDEGNTAVIANKILCPGGEPIKEGDEIMVKVVKTYGDESEIQCAPKKEGESGMGGEGSPETGGNESAELSALSEKGM